MNIKIEQYKFSIINPFKYGRQFEPADLDGMRNNSKNYKWGIFYFNPQDPKIIVSKRNPGMGFMLNFTNPHS